MAGREFYVLSEAPLGIGTNITGMCLVSNTEACSSMLDRFHTDSGNV